MQEKLIILLSEIKIRKYDISRFDIEEFQSLPGHKIEIHELIDYLHPGFSSVFTNTYRDKRIKSFFDFKKWTERLSYLKKKYKNNILILNIVPVANFRSLKVNFFLKKKDIKVMRYSNNHPVYRSKISTKKILLRFREFLSLEKITLLAKNYITTAIAKKLKLFPDYTVIQGRNDIYNFNKNTQGKLILGHSYDYNIYLKNKKKTFLRKNNYGLFLEAPTPVHNEGDSFIMEEDYVGTRKKWLKSVNNFFNFIEEEMNIKILIAPHPKIKYKKKFTKLYNGREVVKHNLSQTAKEAKLIISRDSSGFSYASIYNIPAIFIYTDELKNNTKFLARQAYIASKLGVNPINIDNKISKSKLKSVLQFNKKIYKEYVNKYLTARNDNKKNFEIINEQTNNKN